MDQAAKGLMICQWQFILLTGKFKSGLLFQYHDYGTRAKHDHGRSRSRSIWFIIFTWLKMSCLLGEGSFALDVDPFKTIPLATKNVSSSSWLSSHVITLIDPYVIVVGIVDALSMVSTKLIFPWKEHGLCMIGRAIKVAWSVQKFGSWTSSITISERWID